MSRTITVRRPGPAPAGGLIPVKETPDGWTVATLHWSLVPGYDYQAACQGMTDEAIRMELELDWSASTGKRVYPEYSPKLHLAKEPLQFDPTQILYCGWDFGGTPAWVPTQLNAFGQWLIFTGVAPLEDTTIGIYEFGQLVADHLTREFATPAHRELSDLKLVHFGDPAGAARPPRTGDRPQEMQSCFDVLKNGITLDLGMSADGTPRRRRQPGWGWKIIPGAVNHTDRQEAIRARLMALLSGGLPAMVVDDRSTCVKDGFGGGYCYPQRADGTFGRDPSKNWYSHSMNCVEYIATRLFCRPAGEEDEDDDGLHRPVFRSFAAPREGRWS